MYLAIVLSTAAVLCWISYLIFCGWLVKHTGRSESLRDAAVAARAFPWRRDRPRLPRRDNGP